MEEAGPSAVGRGVLSDSLLPGRNLLVKLLAGRDESSHPPLSHRKGDSALKKKFHFWVSVEKRGFCLPQSSSSFDRRLFLMI